MIVLISAIRIIIGEGLIAISYNLYVLNSVKEIAILTRLRV